MAETNPNHPPPPKAQTPADEPLSSWKEISAFLNVDVRTCQRWEQSFGLPVHRIKDSTRSRVIAYPGEIETWRKTAFRTKNVTANGDPAPVENHTEKAGRSGFRNFIPAIAGLVLLAAAAYIVIPSLDRNPADFRIDGSRLIVCNKHGRRLWLFDTGLARLRGEEYYRERFPAKKRISVEGHDFTGFPFIIFLDRDGDGRNEVLFAPQAADDMNVGILCLFDDRGSLIWRFDCGKDVIVGGRRYPPGFVINILEARDVVGDDRPEIVVGSHAFMEAPAQLVVLDFEKRVLGEYWNFGQLADYEVVDTDRDGRKEIVVVGTNNEYDEGVLFVLDPKDMKGTSPQSEARMFSGMPEGTARHYLRFASTELDPVLFSRGMVTMIQKFDDSFLRAESCWGLVYYDFDEALNPPQVTLTDALSHAYRTAFQKNPVSTPLDKAALRRKLREGVRYFDAQSKTWVSQRPGSS